MLMKPGTSPRISLKFSLIFCVRSNLFSWTSGRFKESKRLVRLLSSWSSWSFIEMIYWNWSEPSLLLSWLSFTFRVNINEWSEIIFAACCWNYCYWGPGSSSLPVAKKLLYRCIRILADLDSSFSFWSFSSSWCSFSLLYGLIVHPRAF